MFGCVCKEGCHDFPLLAEEDFHDGAGDRFKSWKILKHDLGGLFVAHDCGRVFIADEIVFGGALGIEVAHGDHPLFLGEEVGGLLFTIDQDVLPDAAFEDKVGINGYLALPEKYGALLEVLCIHAFLNHLCFRGGKGGYLMEVVDEFVRHV